MLVFLIRYMGTMAGATLMGWSWHRASSYRSVKTPPVIMMMMMMMLFCLLDMLAL